ncbi:MAG: hypothetical protein ABIJ08_01840, partial [Nanoarchaeota archaeon]
MQNKLKLFMPVLVLIVLSISVLAEDLSCCYDPTAGGIGDCIGVSDMALECGGDITPLADQPCSTLVECNSPPNYCCCTPEEALFYQYGIQARCEHSFDKNPFTEIYPGLTLAQCQQVCQNICVNPVCDGFCIPGCFDPTGLNPVDPDCNDGCVNAACPFDLDCPNTEDCVTPIDDDLDGFINCADGDCFGNLACIGFEICDNHMDDDADGLIDCLDPGCVADPICTGIENCGLAGDQDLDGCPDATDSDCGGTESNCADLIDNDCDSLIDCADPDCAADPACTLPTCDNLLNGVCSDPSCTVVQDPDCTCPANTGICDSLCPAELHCQNDPDCNAEANDCCSITNQATDPDCNGCTALFENFVPYECCDSCKQPGSLPKPPGACGSDALCCKECVPLAENYTDCCDYNWACTDNGGTINPYSFMSCQSPKVPCSGATCLTPLCPLYDLIGNSAYQVCMCGDTYYDRSVYASYYCCGTQASPSPCVDTFTLSGRVYDFLNNIGIMFAEVILTQDYRNYSRSNGYYKLPTAETMQYYLTATHPYYYPYHYKYPASGGDETYDIPLIQYYNNTDCSSQNPPAIQDFKAHNITGQKAVTLTWSNPCPGFAGKVDHYKITREPPLSSPIIIPSGLITTAIDYNVSWENRYNYTIYSYYESGYNSTANFTDITLGNRSCDGITTDYELCLKARTGEKVLRYKCNEENSLVPAAALSGQYDCRQADPIHEHICIGPDEDNKTYCAQISNCSADLFNPFGLFFTSAGCEGTNPSFDYCYYDYSNTTVDNCYDCRGLHDCIDYNSESTCLSDNCEISEKYGQQRCQWWPNTMFEDLGKGFCFDQDSNTTDYCSYCNPDNPIFRNTGCTQDLCNKLGDCYAKQNPSTSCTACTNAKCSDYENKEACINSSLTLGNPVQLNQLLPLSINKSDDACDIGLCRWDDMFGCTKDADGDSFPDCEGLPLPGNCEADKKACKTIPEPIPTMNRTGSTITFNIADGFADEDKVDIFYFCLNHMSDQDCTSFKQINPPNLQSFISFNPVQLAPETITQSGVYNLRWYTRDY